jgi:hypothetical protein
VVSLIPWYWDREKGRNEAERLREQFPTLELELDRGNRYACLKGMLSVSDEISYTVNLTLPPNYPDGVPKLWIDSREIPWTPDRHVNQHSGEACLCVRSEYRLHWPRGSNLSLFIERLVLPFFAAQFFSETYGFWPKDAARSHGREGILEAYRDMIAPLGNPSIDVIEKVMRMLATTRRPQGHELCPCGSGLILRACHSAVLHNLREHVASEHATADLDLAFPSR